MSLTWPQLPRRCLWQSWDSRPRGPTLIAIRYYPGGVQWTLGAKQINKILIIGHGYLVNRLPEVFSGETNEFSVIGTKDSPLVQSKFIHNALLVNGYLKGQDKALNSQVLDHLSAHFYDLVISANEEIALAIVKSNLPLDKKLSSLQVGKTEALDIVGSKLGLMRIAQQNGIRFPKSEQVDYVEQLEDSLARVGPGPIIKGDRGAGGARVVREPLDRSSSALKIPSSWYPLIVQEFVDGPTITVDAIFHCGRLTGWTYCEFLLTTRDFGPSARRLYKNPRSFDFELALEKLGEEVGLNGPITSTWIWDEPSKAHVLIELDTRPSAWHQFLPKFGVGADQLFAAGDSVSRQRQLDPEGFALSLYPTELRNAIINWKFGRVCRWALSRLGTWETRNKSDSAVNKFERAEIAGAWKLGLLRPLVVAWNALPIKLRESLESLGVKALLQNTFGFPHS